MMLFGLLADAVIGIAIINVVLLAFLGGAFVIDRRDRRATQEQLDKARAEGYCEGLGKRLQEQRQRFRNRLELHDGPSKN